MEGSESSINRIGRTIWTVWGYLSGAVGRYLKPEVSNEDKQNEEDTRVDVTISKSYRELKENEEEKERSETNTWAQSESPQSGVRVRLAAVQWEKASIRKGTTSRRTGTGVAWNTGVQEGRKEGIDRKAEEERDSGEASDNNNEAVTAKSNDFVEEAFVDAPSSIDAGKAVQDFGNSGSVETGVDAERSEHVISQNAEKAALKNESAVQGVALEEPKNKCGFEDKEDHVTEALDEKAIEHTENQDGSEKEEDKQRTNQRMTENEDEAYTSEIADNLLSHLTYSTKQMEDLFGSPSNKEFKVDGKHTETTESKSEREVIETTVEETKQWTEGTIKDEQDESMHEVVDYESKLQEAKIEEKEAGVATACELLEEPGTANDENREQEVIKQDSEHVSKLTPGNEDNNNGHHQAGQQLFSEKLNIIELKQDEAQFGFTEGIVEIGKELEPAGTVTKYEVILTPETEPTKAIEESKQVTEGTVKEGHHEAGLESGEFKSPEIVNKLDIHESKLDESQTVFKEEMAETECEALEGPATGEMDNVEIYGNEPESFNKGTENDLSSVIEESKQVTLGTTEDEQQEDEQCSESKFAEAVDLCDSKIDESLIQFTEERPKTECDLLQEPVTADLESSKFIGSEIVDKPDIHMSTLDENQTVFPEKMVKPECEPLEEPEIGQMENAEIHGKEPEPISESTENEAAPTTEMESANIIKQSNQVALGTNEEEQQEAKQLSESKFAEAVDLCESNFNESCVQFTEEREKTECDLLEEPVTGHMEVAEIHGEDLEPSSQGTENEEAPTLERESNRVLEESEQAIVGTRKEGHHKAGFESVEFIDSEIANKPDAHIATLDENQTVFTEEMAETEYEPLTEPEIGPMENAEIYGKEPEPISESTENEAAPTTEMESANIIKQSNQVALGTNEEEQQEAKQLSESKFAEAVDLCESNFNESCVQFTEEREKTECDLLEETVTGHMEVAEIHGEDLEPSSQGTENEEAPTLERESNRVLEESEQAIVGTRKEGHHKAGFESVEFIDSEIANKPDAHISTLDENQTVFTEEMAETEYEPLTEPEIGPMENAGIYGKEPEPISESTENEAAPTKEMESANILKQSNQVALGTTEEEQQETKHLNESKFAEAVDLCESKLDESCVQFTEEKEKTECDLLEEHITGHEVEVAEVHGKDLEPSSKGIENSAALLSDSEAISVFLVAPKQEIGVTGKSEQSEADQEQLLGGFVGSDNTEKLDIHGAKIDETQREFTEGMVEFECESTSKVSLMKMTFNDESVDRRAVGAVVKEADQLHQPDENSEAGTTSDVALKIEEELFGDTICDIYGAQIPEVMIKQDSESVIALVTEGPENQSETTEFQQKDRAEVAADVKKSAEMEHVHEQPKSSEHLAHENELQLPEEQISNMQRETRKVESDSAENAEETAVESVDEIPSSSPQELDKSEDSIVGGGVELLTRLTPETKASFTAQKVEVLEVNSELTAVSERVVTEAKCEKAAFETGASETESESNLAAVEAPEKFRRSEASVSDETFGSQSLLKQEEWTVQDRSAAEPHGHQMGYSGELSLPESESALETSEMDRDSEKGGSKDIESPDEADSGLLYEKQVMVASLGVMEEVMRGLKQEFKEREMDTHEKGLTKTSEECVETSDPNMNPSSAVLQMQSDLSDNTVEIRQNLPVEAMDIGSEKERKEEVTQNTTGDDVELLAEGKEDIGVKEEKADDEEKSVVDSNGNLQERSRPGLKRGFEKMARNEESKPTVPKDWAGTSLVLQKVSSLDCSVQKSKIAVKNPHVRPPKDPRTLINKASVEPLAPTRPSQPSPLRKAQGEGLIIPQKGVQGIGFKLPGLGAGFPALRKTDAGRKIRDEGETENTSTEPLPVQKSDTPTETQEDSVKPEQPTNKPKWTPPRHPGMGNPMMMSELKSKLKKTGKE